MNDMYGVDPACPASINDIAMLFRTFGPAHGRFIWEFPEPWLKAVEQHLGALKPVEQHKLVETWLTRGRLAVLPTTVPYRDSLPWSKNAEYLPTECKALIGPLGCLPPLRCLSDLMADPSQFADATGTETPCKADAYEEAAMPLLALSPKVALIDPYFTMRDKRGGQPSTRHRDALSALLREASRSRRVELFCFHVAPDEALINDAEGTASRQDVETLARGLGVHRIRFEVKELPQADGRHKQHARYLLGNGCGLQFDRGFEVHKDGRINHIHWIGEQVLKELQRRFMEERVTQSKSISAPTTINRGRSAMHRKNAR